VNLAEKVSELGREGRMCFKRQNGETQEWNATVNYYYNTQKWEVEDCGYL
jgi:hypothetical protein